MTSNQSIWKSPEAEELVAALFSIDSPELMKAFLRDILTEKEIAEFSNRLKAAKMLTNAERYVDVVQVTGLSSRTVARISTWLKKGDGGYSQVITNLKAHHSHIPPVRD